MQLRLEVALFTFLRWLILILLMGLLYILGRDAFHLKQTIFFFLIIYFLCLLLTISFTLIRDR